MASAQRKQSDATTPRREWAKALLALVEQALWFEGDQRPSGQDGLIKALARQLMGKPDCPKEPEKAVRRWLNGDTPFSKAVDPLCLTLFGKEWKTNDRSIRLRELCDVARKSPKAALLDQAIPPAEVTASNPPETMSSLSWTINHAWQTPGLAALFVDLPAFLNDRDAYKLTVSVSFGQDKFMVDRNSFTVRLRAAWLDPDYRSCHPVTGSKPGEGTKKSDHIEILGEWYRFKGPRPDGEFLAGNPFSSALGTPAAADQDADEAEADAIPATPFAEVVWDRPGANSLTLTVSSYEADLDLAPDIGPQPLSKAREKLIQHYLRKTLARRENGTIHWARATLRGRVRV